MFSLTTNITSLNSTQNTPLENIFLHNFSFKNERNDSSTLFYKETLPNDDVATIRYEMSNGTVNNFTNSFDNFDNYTDYAEIPYYIKATSMSFCIVIMCLGVIGNVMVPIVIFKTKDMRNSTNIFLVNLSIADLMVLLVCTPTVLVEVNSKPETWVLGRELCLAVPFVELTVAHASVLTILAISFERYYAICEPLRAGYVCTKTRATLICALAWFFAALFTSPILAIAEHHIEIRDNHLEAQCLTQTLTVWQTTFFIMIIIGLFIVPLIILIILYTIIAKNLINAASKVVMNKTVDAYNTRARKQVILMLGTVVVCFFVCLLPYRLLVVWIIITPTKHAQRLNPETWYNVLYFTRVMLYINSAINPILYNMMSSKFRIGFCKVCICHRNTVIRVRNRGKRNRTGTLTNTNTNGSTSSSLTRTTNSLKKLFSHKASLDRTNTLKSKNDQDIKEGSDERNILDRLFTRNFFRQNSAPVNSNSDIVKINRICSDGNIDVGNKIKSGQIVNQNDDSKTIGHSKIIDVNFLEAKTMTGCVIDSARKVNVSDLTDTCAEVKIEVNCIVDKKSKNVGGPESFV